MGAFEITKTNKKTRLKDFHALFLSKCGYKA
jgi:hypothetical protein